MNIFLITVVVISLLVAGIVIGCIVIGRKQKNITKPSDKKNEPSQ